MHIEHVAIWTKNLERLKVFYETYFQARSGEKYVNLNKQFTGIIHLAFATDSEQEVDFLTQRFKQDGYPIADGPRHTGDGYYERVIFDPDGNRIEITTWPNCFCLAWFWLFSELFMNSYHWSTTHVGN
jgi:lactoylglutathione lyase